MTAELNWHKLYANGWKGEIVADAFCHPAKFSRKLIQHIYAHLFARGWLHEGDAVLDPFGGVALGALDAMTRGCHWTGCELEARFCDLGQQNISLWQTRYRALPHFGTARIVQGDSRRLREVVQGAACVVSSPPFGEAETRNRSPYQGGFVGDMMKRAYLQDKQGITPGNLANLRADAAAFAAVVASPPYAEARIQQEGSSNAENMRRSSDKGRYGTTPGQLGAMRAGDVDAVVSSPPWEQSGMLDHKGQTDNLKGGKFTGGGDKFLDNEYGQSTGQLGNASGDTFWSAARTIVGECHALLKPGGMAVWVVKSFVRNKAIVDFPGQWRQLCEAAGFETVEVARAWLVEDHGVQLAQDGKHKRKRTERKSFFRRLAEQKGSPRVDYETVLFMVKNDR